MDPQGLLSIQDPLPHPSVYQVSTAYEECLLPIDMYLGPPALPTGVTAVQSGPTTISVFWTAPTSGGPVSRYDIYYVANGVPSTSGGSTTSTSYVLTNLQVGVQYNISVIAVGTYLGSQSALATTISSKLSTVLCIETNIARDVVTYSSRGVGGHWDTSTPPSPSAFCI